jgi:PelA/Pel-15E family pectate lyase
MAENILSLQAPNGGWSKHVDFGRQPRQPGQSYFSESEQWSWISTIDNSSTTEELKFLALIDAARSDPRYGKAFTRGVAYLLEMQFPNGCWPQVWPLEGSYHDAATYNDDATINAAGLLQDIAAGRYHQATAEQRRRAATAVTQTIDCIVESQAVENGKLAVWGQQHDPLTLLPTSARSYELTSLTAQESANVMRFLMGLRSPDARVTKSVHAAARWLDAHKLNGYTYRFENGRQDSPGAGPLWARMYEIGNGRPIFSDRNGIRLYDWNQLKDRRLGYGWYTYAPVAALKEYEGWSRRHPRGRVAK